MYKSAISIEAALALIGKELPEFHSLPLQNPTYLPQNTQPYSATLYVDPSRSTGTLCACTVVRRRAPSADQPTGATRREAPVWPRFMVSCLSRTVESRVVPYQIMIGPLQSQDIPYPQYLSLSITTVYW